MMLSTTGETLTTRPPRGLRVQGRLMVRKRASFQVTTTPCCSTRNTQITQNTQITTSSLIIRAYFLRQWTRKQQRSWRSSLPMHLSRRGSHPYLSQLLELSPAKLVHMLIAVTATASSPDRKQTRLTTHQQTPLKLRGYTEKNAMC